MKGPKTKQDWIEAYEERTGEKFDYRRGFHYYYDPMNGFFSYKYDEDEQVLIGGQTCGNAKFWKQRLWEVFNALKERGCRGIVCSTPRDPKPYQRFCGGKLIRKETIEDFEKGTTVVYHVFFVGPEDVKEVDRYRPAE
jgi:hypothetical protein